MSQTDTSQKIGGYVGYMVGLVSAVISIALFVLMIGLFFKYDPSRPDNESFYMITFGIVAPFALFFGVVGVRSLTSQIANRKELMPYRSWRMLAVFVLISGGIGFIFGHWGALLVPTAIALFCMMKDQRFIELLKSLRLLH